MSKISWFLTNLFNALFNDKQGFSMRKCIAVVIAIVSIIMETALTNEETLTTVLIINFSFIGLLLGIVTTQNLIELKNGKQTTN